MYPEGYLDGRRVVLAAAGCRPQHRRVPYHKEDVPLQQHHRLVNQTSAGHLLVSPTYLPAFLMGAFVVGVMNALIDMVSCA